MANLIDVLCQPCMVCGERATVQMTSMELLRLGGRENLSEIFPHTNAAFRELIITGTHDECWSKMVYDEEDTVK